MDIPKLKRIIKHLERYYKDKDTSRKGYTPDVLDLLIATKLSQNTTDKTSYKAFVNLKNNFKSWDEVSHAPLEKIKQSIKVCGLANTKARNIKEMLKQMKSNYGTLDLGFLKGYSDKDVYKELLQYNGLGVKTISCVLAFSLGRDAFAVDTHVHRVLNRLGIVKTNNAVKTFEEIKSANMSSKRKTEPKKFH